MYEEIGQQVSIRQKQFILNNRESVLGVPRESIKQASTHFLLETTAQVTLKSRVLHFDCFFFKMLCKTPQMNHLSGTISLMVLLST